MDYYILKLVHLTMQAHKSGKINLMIQNLIYGVLDVLFIK